MSDHHDDYVKLFESERGRRVLAHLLERWRPFEPSFPPPGSPDAAIQAAIADGRREVLMGILADIGVDVHERASELYASQYSSPYNEHGQVDGNLAPMGVFGDG